jgi:uncharacterized membrane protein
MVSVALFVAVVLACIVEAVEALTILLAAGTRGWRSTLIGGAAAAITLTVIVVVLGPAISAIPISYLRLLVGGLLLVFGVGWLRKAIMRASGLKALHDEDKIYAEKLAAARAASAEKRPLVGDWYAFTLSFKGVLLEGLEVVFIVLTFGTNQHNVPLAALAAGCAVLLIAGLGMAVRSPLARVPENTMKFVVGVMLTGFGIFWGGEGAGVVWPGSDGALLVLIPAVLAISLLYVKALAPRATFVEAGHVETVAVEEFE